MRPILLILLVFAPGCTHHFLQENTLRTASTLPKLQSQQVMDNLATLAANPEANPWHATLSSGLIQATDQGSGGLLATFQDSLPFRLLTPSGSAQRSLTEQWSVGPVIDGEQLKTLQIVYNKALDPTNQAWDEKVEEQIVDLCIRFTLLPSEETLKHTLTHKEVNAAAKTIIDSLQGENLRRKEFVAIVNQILIHLNMQDGKTYFELMMKRRELQTAIEFRNAQIQELEKLAGLERSGPSLPTKRRFGQSVSPRNKTQTQSLNPSETSDTTLLILTALQRKSSPGYLPGTDLMWESIRNPALVDQAEDQIGALEQLLGWEDDTKRFKTPWLYQSPCKKDVPKCACAVGHATVCGQERYVWVMPEDYATFQRFTRIIMTLTVNAQQDITRMGPTFTPPPIH